MREKYESKTFQKKSMEMVTKCNDIVTSYSQRGFKLTIRQLYYQLVARGHIENTVRSYDNIVALMTNARLAGLIDWDAIEDRTRDVLSRSHWTGVPSMLKSAARWYHEDMWESQPHLVIGIVEKEALAGIFQGIFDEWDIPLLPARGYPSATALRDLAKDRILNAHQDVVILHFGDHDPSGIDMTRDLRERLELFSRGEPIDFRRLALNMDQVEEENPPPNPAKATDSRYESYRAEFGDESWELDALSPEYLKALVDKEVEALIDQDAWDATQTRIEARREILERMANDYDPNDGTDGSLEDEDD